jgi:Predicted acyltransferases
VNKPVTKFSFENNIFDIIRYYAMLQVMINHMAEHFKLQLPAVLQALIKFQGVVILFALSGYLTAASLDRDSMNGDIDKQKFLKKRFFRIFPEYWLCVLINTVVIFVLYSPKPNLKEGLIYVITQFGCLNFYTGDWLRGYGVGAPNGSLWTILVELEFYVIILLIWKWLKNKGIITWSILIACLAGLNYLTAIAGDGEMIAIKLLNCSIIPYLYMFMIGCFFYRFREKIFNCDSRLIAIVGLFFVAMYFVGDGLISGSYLPLLSGIALAAMTIIFGYLFKIKLRAKIDITYGTYLYHMVVVNAIIALGVKVNFVVMGIGIVVSLLLGLMSSRFNRLVGIKAAASRVKAGN